MNTTANNTKRPRKPHFSPQELSALVAESPLKTSVTNADKKLAWVEVTRRVNAVGQGITRTADEVRIKWRDYSTVVKKKAAALRREMAKTGGGSSSLPPLSPEEEKVLAVLGPEATEGTRGGLDIQATSGPPHTIATSTSRHHPANSTSSINQPSSPPNITVHSPPLSISGTQPSTPPSSTVTRPSSPAFTYNPSSSPAASPFYSNTVPDPAPNYAHPRAASSPPSRLRSLQAGCRDPCGCSAELLGYEREKIVVGRAIREELVALGDIAKDMMAQAERHHQESLAAIREQGQRHHNQFMDLLSIIQQQVTRPSFTLHLPQDHQDTPSPHPSQPPPPKTPTLK
ncbi:uncharacterized protein LOC134460500 [Engraulis encrasicolus]|uniref:uncharacterized protein LOC134460500 n=1 Tax=Engraulis encrasicolus TaxID=184585 RepID=UPI002FD230AE